MNHLNKQPNKQGFMLIEVILAVAILGIASVPLLNLQANIMNQVWQEQDYINHLYQLKNLFFMPEVQKAMIAGQENLHIFTQTDAPGFIELKCECVLPDSKSELAGKFADLYLMRSHGTWPGFSNQDSQEDLVTLLYIAPNEQIAKSEPKI